MKTKEEKEITRIVIALAIIIVCLCGIALIPVIALLKYILN